MWKSKTHFELSAAEYEKARAGHMDKRRQELVRQALAALPSSVPPTVLEIGAGSGKLIADLAAAYPDSQFLGTDIEEKMVAYASQQYRRANLTYACVDIVEKPLDIMADFVYSIDVIHHVQDI